MSRFQVPTTATADRRKEKVTLKWGDIWVWEMTVAEALHLLERAARPSFDPRGGVDQGESVIAQITGSCYHGDQEGAELVFTPANLLDVYKLPYEDFEKLVQAIARVNGKDAKEVESLKSFFETTPAGSNSS